MNLAEKYNQLIGMIEKVDFEKLWPGFKPLKFALYNETECYFNGEYIEKTIDFCANTAINYQGEYIAIWGVEQELDLTIWTSKIIHEMFHAFQRTNKWNCFTDEMDALFHYHYDEVNLSMKLHENELLLSLMDNFNQKKYEELLSSRNYRNSHFPYEYRYEAGVEEIEGTANYVEWMVLELIDSDKVKDLIQYMRDNLTKPEYFFPIRISTYLTGALLAYVAMKAGDYCYNPEKRPYGIEMLKDYIVNEDGNADVICNDKNVKDAITNFNNQTDSIIKSSVEKNEVLLSGSFILKGLNIYDARFKNGYITSRYFVMYEENGQDKALNGNFVIKLNEKMKIDKVYRWDL